MVIYLWLLFCFLCGALCVRFMGGWSAFAFVVCKSAFQFCSSCCLPPSPRLETAGEDLLRGTADGLAPPLRSGKNASSSPAMRGVRARLMSTDADRLGPSSDVDEEEPIRAVVFIEYFF